MAPSMSPMAASDKQLNTEAPGFPCEARREHSVLTYRETRDVWHRTPARASKPEIKWRVVFLYRVLAIRSSAETV